MIFDVPVTLEGVRGNRPVLDVATLQLPAGSALRDVTVRGSADRVLVVRGTAERVEVTNSVAGPGTICEVHGTLANSACYTTGTATAVVGDGALRHVTALSGGTALQATGATTAVNSILAGATDFSGNVTLDHTHTGDRDTLFPQLAAGVLLPPVGAPTIDAGAARAARTSSTSPAGRAPRAPRRIRARSSTGRRRRWSRPARPSRRADGATVIGTIAGAGARYHVQYGPDAGYGARTVAVDGTGEVQVVLSGLQAADDLPLPLRGGQRRGRDGRRRPHVHDAGRAGASRRRRPPRRWRPRRPSRRPSCPPRRPRRPRRPRPRRSRRPSRR